MSEIIITSKHFVHLTLDELYGILRLRAEVFVVEQNCPYQDLDGKDGDAIHVFAKNDRKIIGCLRIFLRDDGKVVIGRVVTNQKVRGTGTGRRLMEEALMIAGEQYPGKECVLHAQCYATGFYEKVGFRICSEEFLEDGIPHVEMSINLKS